jgi:hypothetical protein
LSLWAKMTHFNDFRWLIFFRHILKISDRSMGTTQCSTNFLEDVNKKLIRLFYLILIDHFFWRSILNFFGFFLFPGCWSKMGHRRVKVTIGTKRQRNMCTQTGRKGIFLQKYIYFFDFYNSGHWFLQWHFLRTLRVLFYLSSPIYRHECKYATVGTICEALAASYFC